MKHPIANRKFKDSMAFLEKAATPTDPLSNEDKIKLLSFIENAFDQVISRHNINMNAMDLFDFTKAENNIDAAFIYEAHKNQPSLVLYNVTLSVLKSNHATFALHGVLDALASNEDYSKFNNLKVGKYSFLIGDGDDWGAVTIKGSRKEWYDVPKSITFWVRHFG